jgi:D-alanyl-D-alanine carboxypeptidase
MTALILLDNYNYNDYITAKYPLNYEHNGKVANIPENIEISIENLLQLLLVYSANDAAYISAIAVSGNIQDFVFLMNNKAKAFGMDNTNFNNPDGMDELNHYTTLNDLLKLSLKAAEKKEILSLVSKDNFISDISGSDVVYHSTNLLLEEGFVGMKTGWTDMAGLTFIGFNQSNDREIITIVNKSKVDQNKYSHFSDSKLLYKTSIETFNNYKIINKNDKIYTLRNSYINETYKSEIEWNEFINLNEKNSIILTEYNDKKITLSFNKYKKSFKILNVTNKIEWIFNPLKIFKINTNQ